MLVRLTVLLALTACAAKAPPQPALETVPTAVAEPLTAQVDPKWVAYDRAVQAARFPTPDKVSKDLLPLNRDSEGLQWDAEGRVLVTSWSRKQYFDGYEKGKEFALYGETWFTAGTQVRDVCASSGFAGEELDLRLEQLLGLPPGGTYDVFLQVWVHPDDLFRPCADPSVTTTSCAVDPPLSASGETGMSWACGGKDATGMSARALATAPPAPTAESRRARWLCDTWAARYGVSDVQRRYPWTALGYTLDWGAEDGMGEGPSEFVASAGTSAVFEHIVPTAEFCAGNR